FFFFFFFSSRRRHTRSLRDWSSDVCSSDLSSQLHPPCLFRVRSGFLVIAMTLLTWSHTAQSGTPGGLSARPGDRKIELSWAYVRSEERRVGKECRCRWWRDQ